MAKRRWPARDGEHAAAAAEYQQSPWLRTRAVRRWRGERPAGDSHRHRLGQKNGGGRFGIAVPIDRAAYRAARSTRLDSDGKQRRLRTKKLAI